MVQAQNRRWLFRSNTHADTEHDSILSSVRKPELTKLH